MALLQVKLIDPLSGLPIKELPDWSSHTISPVFSAVGSFKGEYPANGINASSVAPDAEIAFYIDGTEVPDTRTFLQEHGVDEASVDEDGTMISVAGDTALTMLNWGKVYPQNWPASNNPASHAFIDATPGFVMKTLIAKCVARGGLERLVVGSWNETHDSYGLPWSTSIGGQLVTITYDAGTNYLDVLTGMVNQGLVEARMFGRTLELFVPTIGIDWTLASQPLVFQRGENLQDAPRNTSLKNLSNVMLVAGDQNVYVEVTDPTSIAARGRREGSTSGGQITDPGTLAVYGEGQILLNVEKIEKTVGLFFTDDPAELRPLLDYNLGDWVFVDNGATGLERLRIKQWSVTLQTDGNFIGSVSLNDLIDEWEERVNRTLTGLLSGATPGGGSDPPGGTDAMPPAAPASCTIGSLAYLDSSGFNRAQITISWPPVTLNLDGTAITDLAGYEVGYSTNGLLGPWTQQGLTTDTAAYASPFDLGILVLARVRAVDTSGNRSAWTYSAETLTAIDNTPPPVPFAPTASSRLGTITVSWNGLGSVGEAMPLDFSHVEVHGSIVDDFVPSSASYLDRIPDGRGAVVFTQFPYNVEIFFKLVAVDFAGNASDPSGQASTQTVPLVDTDLIGEIIDGAHIIDGTLVAADKIVANTITGGLIQALAISTGKLAANAVTADKVTAGAITAEKLSFGVISTNLVLNPGFEDVGTVNADPGQYAQVPDWTLATLSSQSVAGYVDYQGPTTQVPARSGVSKVLLPCTYVTIGTSGNGTTVQSDPIAVDQAQDYVFAAYLSGTGRVRVRLLTSPDGATWTEVPDGLDDVVVNLPGGSYSVLKNTKTIPIGHHFAAVKIYNIRSWQTGFLPGVSSLLAVDDVSLTLAGYGAVELTSAGLRMFNESGDETMNLTGAPAAGGNYLTIQSGGVTQISLDGSGDITASGVGFFGGLSVAGTDFFDWLAQLDQGTMAWANRPTIAFHSNVEQPYSELQFTSLPGRLYKVETSAIVVRCDTANGVVQLRLRHSQATVADTAAPAVGITSTQIAGHDNVMIIANQDQGCPPLIAFIDTSAQTEPNIDHRVLVTWKSKVNTYDSLIDATDLQPLNMMVEDIGPSVPDTGIDRTQTSPPGVKKNYREYFACTWTQRYKEDGTKNLVGTDASIAQGFYSDDVGNQKSMIGFPYTTIATRIAGATLLAVELYLWFYDWYGGSPIDLGGGGGGVIHPGVPTGTAVVGYHNQGGTSAPATFSGVANLLQHTGWARNTPVWLDLTSTIPPALWVSQAARGIVLGPGPTISHVYNGSAYGKSSAHPPVLRLTYSR